MHRLGVGCRTAVEALKILRPFGFGADGSGLEVLGLGVQAESCWLGMALRSFVRSLGPAPEPIAGRFLGGCVAVRYAERFAWATRWASRASSVWHVPYLKTLRVLAP